MSLGALNKAVPVSKLENAKVTAPLKQLLEGPLTRVVSGHVHAATTTAKTAQYTGGNTVAIVDTSQRTLSHQTIE